MYLSEATPDEDKQFFDSLIPHIKKIPEVQKLTFRNEIQNLVQRYAYPQNPPPLHGTQQLKTFNYDGCNLNTAALNTSTATSNMNYPFQL